MAHRWGGGAVTPYLAFIYRQQPEVWVLVVSVDGTGIVGGERGWEAWEWLSVVVGVILQMVPLIFLKHKQDHIVCAWPQGI